MSRMKVLHLFYTFPNKEQPFNQMLLRRLHEAGVDVAAVSRAALATEDRSMGELPFRAFCLDAGNSWFTRRLNQGLRLTQAFKYGDVLRARLEEDGALSAMSSFAQIVPVLRENPDVVHIHHMHAANRQLIDAMNCRSTPWIVTVRGYDLMVYPLISRKWRDRVGTLLGEASAIHAVSGALGERAVEMGASADRVHVIHRSIEADDLDRSVVELTPPFRLISVGRLVWEKGHLYALDAIASLVKMGIEVEYHVAGDGYLEPALRFRAWQLGIEDRLTLHGFVPRSKLGKLLKQAHVMLHPSFTEGLPNAIVRAQAMGIPVIGVKTGGIPEVVKDGVTGLLVPPADAAALRDAAVHLFLNPELWKAMGESARKQTSAQFAPELEIKRLQQLYAMLAEREPGSRRHNEPIAQQIS